MRPTPSALAPSCLAVVKNCKLRHMHAGFPFAYGHGGGSQGRFMGARYFFLSATSDCNAAVSLSEMRVDALPCTWDHVPGVQSAYVYFFYRCSPTPAHAGHHTPIEDDPTCGPADLHGSCDLWALHLVTHTRRLHLLFRDADLCHHRTPSVILIPAADRRTAGIVASCSPNPYLPPCLRAATSSPACRSLSSAGLLRNVAACKPTLSFLSSTPAGSTPSACTGSGARLAGCPHLFNRPTTIGLESAPVRTLADTQPAANPW